MLALDFLAEIAQPFHPPRPRFGDLGIAEILNRFGFAFAAGLRIAPLGLLVAQHLVIVATRAVTPDPDGIGRRRARPRPP